MRAQRVERVEPGNEQCRTVLGQVVVPDVEGAQIAGTPAASGGAGRLQQCRALLEDTLVVGADAGDTRTALHEQLVQELAPLTRIPPHDREILRGEQDRAEHSEHIAWTRSRRAIELGPIGPPRRDLDLDA